MHQSPKLALEAPAARSSWEIEHAAHKIVGTSQVSYAAGGTVYGEALIQRHSDGTEWDNIDFPVLSGNLCMGSWKVVGEDRVSRYHVGWLYTDGVVVVRCRCNRITDLTPHIPAILLAASQVGPGRAWMEATFENNRIHTHWLMIPSKPRAQVCRSRRGRGLICGLPKGSFGGEAGLIRSARQAEKPVPG